MTDQTQPTTPSEEAAEYKALWASHDTSWTGLTFPKLAILHFLRSTRWFGDGASLYRSVEWPERIFRRFASRPGLGAVLGLADVN